MHFFSSRKKSILAASTLFAVLSLAACGGSTTSDSGEIKTGVFIDSAVEGLTYVSGHTTGKTDAAGTFKYENGQAVTFKVGDITLATLWPKAVMTPVDLVTGAVDESNSTVSNIAIFLQSIDDDDNPANGIKISAATDAAAKGKILSFNLPATTFSTDAALAAITATTMAGASAKLTTLEDAQGHLRTTLLSRLIGNYEGTYTGSAAGGFNLNLDAAGVISGTGTTNPTGSFAITGTALSKGAITFTAATGIAFTGTLNPDTGALAGTWTLAASGGSGKFTGSKK